MSKHPFHYDMPKVAPKAASEAAIQASCKLRVETQFDARFVAIPNGGKRGWQGQRLLKQEGVKKGFPDAIIIGGARNTGKIAFAEFKANSHLSPEQTEMLYELNKNGHHCGVFRSQDTLVEKLKEWGWV